MARTPSDLALITLEELIPYLTDSDFPDYTDEQKQNFQLIINGVSEYFHTHTKKNIRVRSMTDYFNGGSTYVLDAYPVVTLTEVRDVIADKETTEHRLIESSGIVVFSPALAIGDYRYKVTYTAGIAATVGDVPEVWKMMCASAVTYMQNRDAANFTRAVEGVAIYPRSLPPMVMEFLNKERDRKM